jgi:RNA polymerase sigma-70 factor (ECF subfamily)
MEIQTEKKDFILAQRICNELRSGNREALSELYHKYYIFFSGFTRQRLYNSWDYPIEHVLSDFWVELLNSKAICNYKGKASLRTYLSVILSRRIIDVNRKIKGEKTSRIAFEDQRNEIPDKDYLQQSAENDFIKKELQKLIYETLLKLAEISPRDSNLIRMHFEGMTYEEMAEKELLGERHRPRKLRKKTDAIRKQFTRARTGSMAKFGNILNKSLKKNALNYKDLLN